MVKSSSLLGSKGKKKPIMLLAVLGLVGLTGIGMAAFLGNANNKTSSESEAANVPMVCGYEIKNGSYSGCKIVYLNTVNDTKTSTPTIQYMNEVVTPPAGTNNLWDRFMQARNAKQQAKLDAEQRYVADDNVRISDQKGYITGDNFRDINNIKGQDYVITDGYRKPPADGFSNMPNPITSNGGFANMANPIVSDKVTIDDGDRIPLINDMKKKPATTQYSIVSQDGNKECVPFNDTSKDTKRSNIYVVLSKDKKSYTRSYQDQPTAFNLGCKEVKLLTMKKSPKIEKYGQFDAQIQMLPPVSTNTDQCVFCQDSKCQKISELTLKTCNTVQPTNQLCVTEFNDKGITCRVVTEKGKVTKPPMSGPIIKPPIVTEPGPNLPMCMFCGANCVNMNDGVARKDCGPAPQTFIAQSCVASLVPGTDKYECKIVTGKVTEPPTYKPNCGFCGNNCIDFTNKVTDCGPSTSILPSQQCVASVNSTGGYTCRVVSRYD